jgi:hypothetical protein
MVHVDQEQMCLGTEDEQRGPEQWALAQLKPPLDLGLEQSPRLQLALRLGQRREVEDREVKLRGRIDDLEGLTLECLKARAQTFVAANELLKASHEQLPIQFSCETKCLRDVIGWAGESELLDKP